MLPIKAVELQEKLSGLGVGNLSKLNMEVTVVGNMFSALVVLLVFHLN